MPTTRVRSVQGHLRTRQCSACPRRHRADGRGRQTMRLFPHTLERRIVLSGYRVPAAELHRRGTSPSRLSAAATPGGKFPERCAVYRSYHPKAFFRVSKHAISRPPVPESG